jgi:PAS domain S-box-containing protein
VTGMIEEATNIVKLVGGVVALLGGPPAVWHGFRRVNQVLGGVTEIKTRVGRIEENLGTNGGKSLRDAVDRIEDRVRVTAAGLLALTNTLDHAMFLADVNGNVEHANKAFEALTGYQRGELAGAGWMAALREDDRHRVAEGWMHAVKDRRIFHTVAVFQHREGYDVHTRIVAHPMRHERTDEVIGWFATIEIRGASNLQAGRAKAGQEHSHENHGV